MNIFNFRSERLRQGARLQQARLRGEALDIEIELLERERSLLRVSERIMLAYFLEKFFTFLGGP